MRTKPLIVSACRRCQFYQGEGRRGGHCQQLGVPVSGGWNACSLAIPPFSPSWENIEGIMQWQQDVPGLQPGHVAAYAVVNHSTEVSEVT